MKTRKVGKNKGIARIWLEAGELNQNGILHGMRFDSVSTAGKISVTINPAGKRKIAGKPGREIIDMTGATVAQAGFAIGDLFTIVKTTKGIDIIAVS